MNLVRRRSTWRLAWLSVWALALADGSSILASEKENLTREVAAVLIERCVDCHSGSRPKGNLDLTREALARKGGKSGPAVTPGKLGESAIWERIHDGDMPPKEPLSEREKQLVKRWIEAGAPWGDDPLDPFRVTTSKRAGADWWSLKPVIRPRMPETRNLNWARNGIDRFILSRLETAGLAPSPEADRRTLIRRLSLDLLGLPPSPEDVDVFVSDDLPDAYERLVDRLLASPHYGERWARHWLDVVRFGESDGFERNAARPRAWPYREWVIQALNSDIPYDEFCRMQIAGDILRPGDADAVKATGFLVAGIHNTVVPNNPSAQEAARQDELEDLVGGVGQTFLGLTVNCARCHDHKFDPIAQKDYYRLASALAGVTHGERSFRSTDSQRKLDQLAAEISSLRERLVAIEEPARRAAVRLKAGTSIETAPTPLAAWDFRSDLRDRIGTLHAQPIGEAKITPTGLMVDGKNRFARTVVLTRALREKTLEVWVRLANLEQRGGAAITIQTADGAVFDAIVFGEKESRHWMAGSNHFLRTASFRGIEETEADRRPVHFAITYAADGTITGYRDGQPYGKPYRSTGLATFPEGKTVVAFGVRHEPAGGNRMLEGAIVQARLYDRALAPAEVAASANNSAMISEADLVSQLSPPHREERARVKARLSEAAAEQTKALSESQVKIYAAVPKQPPVTHLLIRGQASDRGETVPPGGLTMIASKSADFALAPNSPESDRRVKLATWLTDPANPLFGRVMVNRLWHYHFGIGLVETPNDFGFNGGRPSHPELLDWLTAEFVEGGYRLKALHRLIVTSSTYRQISTPRRDGLAIDADSRLLWRKRPVRVEGEALRDSMLSVADLLNREMGGRGFSDYQEKQNSGTLYFDPIDPVGNPYHRRSVYRFLPRGGNQGLLEVFDCPDPASAAPRRNVTTTPMQALALWNGAFSLRMAEALADRVRRDVPDDVTRQTRLLYRLTLQREPSPLERDLAHRLVAVHGPRALARALLNTNEFLTIE